MARVYDNLISNDVGATFSGATGTNTKNAVIANGQVVSKTTFPELSTYFSNQTSLEFSPGSAYNNITAANGTLPQNSISQYPNCIQVGTYVIFVQPVLDKDGSAKKGFIWYTTNGENWKLADYVTGELNKVTYTNNNVFIATSEGLWKSPDGITYTKVLSGSISDIASNGTTYVIANFTSALTTTTDFITFTSVTAPAAISGLQYYGTNFVAFRNNNTTVYYSASGSTWLTATPTVSITPNWNHQFVVNGYLIAISYTTTQALFSYTTDPIAGTWTSSAQTWISTTLPNPINNIAYDSTTGSYLFSSCKSNASTTFAYKFTSISSGGSALTWSASPTTADGPTAAYKLNGSYFIVYGFDFTKKDTLWNTGGVSYQSTTTIQNPFSVDTSKGTGATIAGTTTLGNRYIIKPVAYNGTNWGLSCLVESNGYFYPLIDTATTPYWSNSSYTNGNEAWSGIVYEDAYGYCIAVYEGSPLASTTIASYNTNRIKVFIAQNNGSPSANNTAAIAVPNWGIVLWNISAYTTTTRTQYYITTTSTALQSFTTVNTGGTSTKQVRSLCALLNGDLIAWEVDTSAPTSTPSLMVFNRALQTKAFTPILINTSETSVAITANGKIIAFNNIYYYINGAIVYKSYDGTRFEQCAVGGVEATSTSIMSNNSASVFTQTSDNYISGTSVNFNNQFGVIRVNTWGTASSNSNPLTASTPFKVSPTLYYYSATLSSAYVQGVAAHQAFDATTQFKVPNGSAPTTTTQGVTTYIVAR